MFKINILGGKMEFEELGYGNKDGFCPHCGEFYEQNELEEMLYFDKVTDFECRKCKKWIRGFCDFSDMGSDVECHLLAIELVKNNK